MAALSFALTKIIVADIDAMERFYMDCLGLVSAARLQIGVGEGAMKESILDVPNGEASAAKLGLVQYLNKPAPSLGEAVVVFMVDDVEQMAAKMLAAGGKIIHPITEIAEHHLKLAYVADPEGHVVEIMQSVRAAQL